MTIVHGRRESPRGDPLAELARLIGQNDPFSEFGPRARLKGDLVVDLKRDAAFEHNLKLDPRRKRVESPAGDTPYTHHKWWMRIFGSSSREVITAPAADAPVSAEDSVAFCSRVILENVFERKKPWYAKEICPVEIVVRGAVPLMTLRWYHMLLDTYKPMEYRGGILGEIFPKRGNAIYRWQQAPYDGGFKYWGTYCYDHKLPDFPTEAQHLLRAFRM